MSQGSYFKSRPDLLTLGGGGVGVGNRKFLINLGRYVIDVTGLDSLSLGELGGGVQCFGEFGASGRVRTIRIGRRVRELHRARELSGSIKFFSPIRPCGGLKGEEKLEKLTYFNLRVGDRILMNFDI